MVLKTKATVIKSEFMAFAELFSTYHDYIIIDYVCHNKAKIVTY